MMRLKLKNEKIKTCFVMFSFACFVSFACLCLLPLTVRAEGVASFPLPYGAGSNYGYSDFPLTESIVTDVNTFLSNQGITSNALLVSEIASDNSYITFYYVTSNLIYACNNESQWPAIAGDNVIFARSDTNGNYCSGGSVTYVVSSKAISYVPDQYIDGRIDIRYLLSNGSLPPGLGIRFYPVYYNSNSDITGYGWVGNSINYSLPMFYFAGDTSSGGSDDFTGSATGSITSKSDGSYDLDLNINVPDYSQQFDHIGGSLDSIDGSLDSIEGKIDTSNNWLGRIWQAITDYFTPPTQQEVTTALQGFPVFNDLTNTIGNTKTTVNSIFDFSQIQPKTADNVDFDYPFHWKVYNPSSHSFVTKTTTVHIVFSWFESVRTPVTLVLSVFLVLGFLIYIFRQIPNLINGVGGGASAGMSVAEHMKGSDKK